MSLTKAELERAWKMISSLCGEFRSRISIYMLLLEEIEAISDIDDMAYLNENLLESIEHLREMQRDMQILLRIEHLINQKDKKKSSGLITRFFQTRKIYKEKWVKNSQSEAAIMSFLESQL